VISERAGIEIDYCPTCRGVWLDRGELDKIIERNAAQSSMPPPSSPWSADRSKQDFGHDARQYGHRKRKKSFLEELFD
jgi:Zn-finger nucleic acid-binding protein